MAGLPRLTKVQHLAQVFFGNLTGVDAPADAMFEDLGQRRAGHGEFGRQAIHRDGAGIAHHQLLFAVVEAQALRHVVECRVEALVLAFEFGLLQQQFFLLGVELAQGLVERQQRQAAEVVVGQKASNRKAASTPQVLTMTSRVLSATNSRPSKRKA
jgi:hypothetical protein